MNELQYKEFGLIAQQCDSGQYRSINVASMIRSDAVVAAWHELERLRAVNNDLLGACEGGHSGVAFPNTLRDIAYSFGPDSWTRQYLLGKANQIDATIAKAKGDTDET